MTITIFPDYQRLSLAAAEEIVSIVKDKEDAVLCLAAGDTPRAAYAFLAQKAKSGEVDFAQCAFIGLDEWVGIPPYNPGSCHFFLQEHLFKPLGVKAPQIHLFNALSKDLAAECDRMNKVVIEKGGIDFMLVGVGMNGHIGFNEPGVRIDQYAHVVDLDATTQTVGQKYFNESTQLQKGITLGLRHFLESRKGVLLASGAKKADVVRRALTGPVDPEMPASLIRRHLHGVAMLDNEAASLLGGRAGR